MTLAAPATGGLPLVAIVGRPNVGKSSLFNRIVGRRQAIVEEEAGTTRDRHYGEADWHGRTFAVVDTGGLMGEAVSGPYATPISAQVGRALEEADAIFFVLDVQAGVLPLDQDVAALLRQASQPVFLVLNKADNAALEAETGEFFRLGLGEPQTVSALHGLGVGDLLDRVVERLPQAPARDDTVSCRLAIVGRPNVGKSSLVNAMLQEERMIVAAEPGTTRDAVDTALEMDGKQIVLVDTAGIRRPGRLGRGVERAAVTRARRAIGRADVVAVVLDAADNIAAQDMHILGAALEAARGLILVINKSDLIKDDAEVLDRRARQLRWRARFVPWAPAIWTSALTRRNLETLLRTAVTVAEERRRRIPTGVLNAMMKRAITEHPPGAVHGRAVKIFYATQTGVEPPTFLLFVNYPDGVHFSYQRFLERRIRSEFGFEGAALRLILRKRGDANG